MQFQYLPSDLAKLQVDNEDIKRKQQMAQAFQQAGFNPVQGGNTALTLLASLASTLRGNSMMKDSSKSLSENLAAQFEAQAQADQAKAKAAQRQRDEDFKRELEKIGFTEKTKAGYREPSKIDPLSPEGLAAQAQLKKLTASAPGPSESDRKIQQLRSLGATDDQIRTMLLGTSGQGSGEKVGPIPAGMRLTADGTLERIPGAPEPQQEQDPRAALAHDALRWVSAMTGKPISSLQGLKPDEVAGLVQSSSPTLSGPLLGSLPGTGMTTEAIKKQMAAKLARLNNPKGTVTDPDFRAAEDSLPDVSRMSSVNAEIIRDMLMQAQGQPPSSAPPSGAGEQPPVPGAQKAPDGNWYVQQNGKFMRVDP